MLLVLALVVLFGTWDWYVPASVAKVLFVALTQALEVREPQLVT